MEKRYVLPETVFMSAICLADAFLTIYLVHEGKASEANPVLAWSFQHGSLAFMLTKLASFLPALTVVEWARPRVGEFGRLAMRAGIIAYVLCYVIGSLASLH